MTAVFPFGETVIWQQRSVTSPGYGNDVATYAPTTIKSAGVHPGNRGRGMGGSVGREITQGQDLTSYDMMLVIPPEFAVGATDRFTVRGQVYEVSAPPATYRNSYTGTVVQEIVLMLVTG